MNTIEMLLEENPLIGMIASKEIYNLTMSPEDMPPLSPTISAFMDDMSEDMAKILTVRNRFRYPSHIIVGYVKNNRGVDNKNGRTLRWILDNVDYANPVVFEGKVNKLLDLMDINNEGHGEDDCVSIWIKSIPQSSNSNGMHLLMFRDTNKEVELFMYSSGSMIRVPVKPEKKGEFLEYFIGGRFSLNQLLGSARQALLRNKSTFIESLAEQSPLKTITNNDFDKLLTWATNKDAWAPLIINEIYEHAGNPAYEAYILNELFVRGIENTINRVEAKFHDMEKMREKKTNAFRKDIEKYKSILGGVRLRADAVEKENKALKTKISQSVEYGFEQKDNISVTLEKKLDSFFS